MVDVYCILDALPSSLFLITLNNCLIRIGVETSKERCLSGNNNHPVEKTWRASGGKFNEKQKTKKHEFVDVRV